MATVAIFVVSCVTSTDEGSVGVSRKQFMMVPAETIEAESAKGYEQIKLDAKSKNILNVNPSQVKRVQDIAKRLIPYTAVFRADALKWNWEVNVISANELNAYCMPGGKIMFYSGIIDQLKMTDAEIAAVMGHEIAHAFREHGREQYSQELLKQLGVGILVASGKVDEKYIQLGLVASTFLSLKHGRGQESEADTVGLELMARAGYNPKEAVTLWQKMQSAAGGASPPEFLSTHPSSETRIKDISALLPRVSPIYDSSPKP